MVLELLGVENYNVGSDFELKDVAHDTAACESSRYRVTSKFWTHPVRDSPTPNQEGVAALTFATC